jgi:predicted HTH transcriptional regulator
MLNIESSLAGVTSTLVQKNRLMAIVESDQSIKVISTCSIGLEIKQGRLGDACDKRRCNSFCISRRPSVVIRSTYPTNAILLLSNGPLRKCYFPCVKIECAPFKGSEQRVFLDQTTKEGPIHVTIAPVMAFIKKNIAMGPVIGEIYRQERLEYSLEAIREVLINALIHCDRAPLGSDIKVAIYDDMREITGPGPLPDTMPIEELGSCIQLPSHLSLYLLA